MCTLHREKITQLSLVHQALERHGRCALEKFDVAIGRYVIMPDHIHLFVRGGPHFVLGEWIKGLKRAISNHLKTSGEKIVWQPGFFDHLLRSDESYGQKWEYVRENPVRACLVESASDWPYQGEIVYIDRA